MFEKGIQGGIKQAVKHHAKANEKYMKDQYIPDEESIYISSVCGCKQALRMDNLPTHGFLWKVTEDFTPEKLDKLVKKDKRGYLLEVDVEYPKGLLENHNELPFLAEGMKIGREEKLVPNLKKKTGYVVQIKALNQALKHGLKLKKVNRVTEFQHGKWMKAYIMLNTRLGQLQRMSLRRTSLS